MEQDNYPNVESEWHQKVKNILSKVEYSEADIFQDTENIRQ
jgi:hypothetical protein